MNAGLNIFAALRREILLAAHPVGAIYTSDSPTSPAELFGGTWERLEGRFVLGASAAHPAGSTGGEEAVALKTANIAPHQHNGGNAVLTYMGEHIGDSGIPGSNRGFSLALQGGLQTNLGRMATIDGLTGTGEGTTGAAHNNMPPYYAAYVWRRLA